jgi:xylitol oxidase
MNQPRIFVNWAANYRYNAGRLHFPKTIEELQELTRNCEKVKALGTRHSFNAIADTPGDHVSLAHFDEIVLDRQARTVTVGAGVNYGQLAPYLHRSGHALHNLASLPHIGVVGACATATHGSGVTNACLSSSVASLEFIDGRGELSTLSRGQQPFEGAVVGLGALGVVTSITLDVLPAFTIGQAVYENLSFDRLENNLEQIFSSGYSVSVFTDWQDHRAAQVWIKRCEPAIFEAEFFGARLATEKLHPLPGHPAENCTDQLGIPGAWHERLPHFRMEFTPSSGAELQSEYFVARENGYEAMLAIEELRDRITPHLYVTELRAIAADGFWLSPFYKRATLGIHFTWKPDWAAVKALLPLIEERLARFDVRPHWAKLFMMTPSYPKMAEFKKLVEHYDRQEKFRNAFLDANLYGPALRPLR